MLDFFVFAPLVLLRNSVFRVIRNSPVAFYVPVCHLLIWCWLCVKRMRAIYLVIRPEFKRHENWGKKIETCHSSERNNNCELSVEGEITTLGSLDGWLGAIFTQFITPESFETVARMVTLSFRLYSLLHMHSSTELNFNILFPNLHECIRNFCAFFQIHVCLIISEAKLEAGLVYSLRAISQYFANNEEQDSHN